MIRICGTAAGAIEPCPAVAALLARINIAGGEFIAHGGVCNTRPNVSEQEFIIPDKLMTGIQIAPRSDRQVFRAGPSARYALIYARAARKVDHIVIERERLALVIALEHKFGKLFVLFEHCRLILFGKRSGVARACHNGFHAQFGKAEIEHHLYVLQKIRVCVSKRAAHIIPLALARFNKLLKLRNDGFPAALARIVHAIPVVNFLPSEQRCSSLDLQNR